MKQNQNVPAHVLHAADTMLRPYGLDLSALLRKATEQHKDKRYISIAEAEECFGLKRWTVGRLIRAGKIDAVKLAKAKSGKVLIDRDSLTEYLEGCRRNVSWSVRSFFFYNNRVGCCDGAAIASLATGCRRIVTAPAEILLLRKQEKWSAGSHTSRNAGS